MAPQRGGNSSRFPTPYCISPLPSAVPELHTSLYNTVTPRLHETSKGQTCPCLPAAALYHCTPQSTVYIHVFSVWFFMYYLCEKYYKPITGQYYIADCVSWVWVCVCACSPGSARGQESACQCRRHKGCSFDPWARKIPWEMGLATHSSILAWRILRTEEPGGLQSTGLQSWTQVKRLSVRAHIIIPDCISCIPRLTLLDLNWT